MPTDTSVKFLHSGLPGAPTLAGLAGSLVALLDACLVDGFGLVTIDSLTIAGGVGTIQRGAGLPFEAGAVLTIAGASVTGGTVNGERKLVAVTGTAGTFDATGLPDQTASGAITAKLAPLGWAKTFAGTNLAAYKPTDVTATGCLLRVDDTAAQHARVRGYETMSDVNTGTGLFPTDATISGGLYWPKSQASDATARQWALVGDGRIFYLMVAYSSAGSAFYGLNHVFGDFTSVKSPDAYACLINGHTSAAFGTNGNNGGLDFDHADGAATAAGLFFARGYSGLGGHAFARKTFPSIGGTAGNKSGALGLPYPNYADGGVYLAGHYLLDSVFTVLRGSSPGFYCFPQLVTQNALSNREYLTGVSGHAGKTFRVMNSAVGCFAFDTTGPWR